MEPRGGGGTELTPILNLLNDYTDDVADIQGIIIFTDGEFRPVAKDKEPDIPVLWASTDEIPNRYHKTDVNFGDLGYSDEGIATITATLRPDRCILVYRHGFTYSKCIRLG